MDDPVRRATFIIRLWTDDSPPESDAVWRGTAEHIGGGQSRQFTRLEDLFDWLRQELGQIPGHQQDS